MTEEPAANEMELQVEMPGQGGGQQMGGHAAAPSHSKAKRAALGVVPANGADRLPVTNPEPAKRRKLLRGGRMLQPDASFDGASAASAASKPAAKSAVAKKQQRNLSLFSSFVDKTNFKVPKMKGTAASARLMQQQRDARRGKK